jgi:hypothetical protein
MKRLLVLLMVFALSAYVPMTALAASSAPVDPDGYDVYLMTSGKISMTLSVSYPVNGKSTSVFSVTVSLPNAGLLGDEFYFDAGAGSDGSNLWSDDYAFFETDANPPTYTENSKGYTVDLTGDLGDFADAMASSLSDVISSYVGITDNFYPTVSKGTITGTATSAGKLTATMTIVITFTDDLGLSGKITVSGTFGGALESTSSSARSAGVRQTKQEIAKTIVEHWSRGLVFQKVLPGLLGLPAK